MNVKNTRKLIGATILSGAIAAYSVFGCGTDELANKNKNSPVPQDEITNTDYDAGSMIPDAGVQDAGKDAGVLDAAYDAGSMILDAGVQDAGIKDAGVLDAAYDAAVSDAGTLDGSEMDAALADASLEDSFDAGYDAAVSDAGTLDSSDMDAALADVSLEDVLNADAGEIDGSLDGAIDGGSNKPVIKYTLNGVETNYASVLMDQQLNIQATATSPTNRAISEYCADLEGYVNLCAGNGQSIVMDGWPSADYNYVLGITACDEDGECATEEAQVYVQP